MEKDALKTTVACVLRQNGKPFGYPTGNYSSSWVRKLRNMVRRSLDIEYEFVCLTNTDLELSGVRTIPLKYDLPGWWSKLELFDPLNALSGRVLYLDLDVLLLKSLVPFIAMQKLMGQPMFIGSAFGKPKKKVFGVRPGYNSSVFVFDHESRVVEDIWKTFLEDPERHMRKLRGDQDFLKEYFPDISTFPSTWIIKLGMCYGEKGMGYIPDATKVMLCMPLKNDEACQRYEFVREIWK